jgi:lipopolysaccharide/colanic/teichoic acid biosynthesis glycosyltransferase
VNRQLGITDDPYGFVENDPRITRSGRFLRRTSLDELPQLFNVVRGEMSLVGPRADIVEQVANYGESDRRRLAVKPGITGWAQVNGRDSIPWPKRFELDAWYVDNWTFGLDWKIIGMTVRQLFGDRPEPVVDEMNIERAKTQQR